MNNLLTILFCLLDAGTWGKTEIVSWAEKMIAKLNKPNIWIIDLSICSDVGDAIDKVRLAMRSNGVLLPDDVGDLLVGLILLRFDSGELSEHKALEAIFDIVDAYGASQTDAEAVFSTSLNDRMYMAYREIARAALAYMGEEKYMKEKDILFEE